MEALFELGKAYYFRTVTHHQTGRVKRIVGKFIELEEAAWVADSGRWHDALMTGTLSEVEPFPHGVIINSDSLVDATPWMHDLPKVQI
jgi:hypothetical protein